MAISDRFAPASPLRTFSTVPTKGQQAPKAAAQVPQPPAATARRELFATGFDTTPQQRTAAVGGDLLPPSMSPPSDDRLIRAIVDAYQSVYGTTKFPSGPERTSWLAKAQQMRDTDKMNAREIQSAITGQLNDIADGMDNTGLDTLKKLIEGEFKLAYGNERRVPTQGEWAKWLPIAQMLADQNMSAKDIKMELRKRIQEASSGMDNTGPDTLKKLIEGEFKLAYGDDRRVPTQGEYAKWLPIAQKLADQKMSSKDIKMELRQQIQLASSGMDNTGPDTLKKLIEGEFKLAYGDDRRVPTQGEWNKWMPIAQKLADQKMSAMDIKMELRRQIQTVSNGMDRTDDTALRNLIEKEFRFSLDEPGRQLSPREASEWLKIAQELRDKNKASATDIKHEIRRQLQTTIANR